MTATEELHATAVLTKLNAAGTTAYDLDTLKQAASLPSNYNEITIERRFGGTDRNVATTTRRGWRITARSVGLTVSNAREMRRLHTAALEGLRVVVDGKTSTPIKFESADPIGEDDGRWSGLTTYTYAI